MKVSDNGFSEAPAAAGDTIAPDLDSATVTNTSPTNSLVYNLSYGPIADTYNRYCILENDTDVNNCVWIAAAVPASYTVSAVENAKTLSFWLQDAADNISTRVDSNVVTLDQTDPSAATAIAWAEASPHGDTGINSTWTKSASGDLDDQEVQYYSDGTCTTASGAAATIGDGTTQTDSWTAPGVGTFSFKVTSIDAAGNSSTSACSNALEIVAPPSNLSYSEQPAIYLKGQAMTTLSPTVTGTVTSYSVAPALPAGITLNTTNGQISGTPTAAASPGDYTITATNPGGSTTFAWRLTVKNGGPYSPEHLVGVATAVPSWSTGSNSGGRGVGPGLFNEPSDMIVDSANGVFYVADRANDRITKHTLATGAFVGWIGKIKTGRSPTGGDPGCNGATNYTPGWCTGGESVDTASFPAIPRPTSMAVNLAGDLLYVGSGNGAILKLQLSTGAFLGWIGKIAVRPTGGAAGCDVATTGTFTPGWCTGGTSTAGTPMIDGVVGNYPYGLAIDVANDSIYATDSNNHRISKYDLTSGTFIGWIGKIATSPSGGAAGCNGAAVGTITPGWCTGGSSASGTNDGAFSSPRQLDLDSSGTYFYVTDTSHRLMKFDAGNGTFVGWYGEVAATPPTGGDAGCTDATNGDITPGWCTGGTANTGVVAYATGLAIQAGSSLIYGVSGANINGYTRVFKIAMDGSSFAWSGQVKTQPTGGVAGCTTTSPGNVTPGWCTGGTSNVNSHLLGSFYGSRGVRLDTANSKIYIADSGNNRVVRLSMDGTGYEWIGGALSVSGWGTAASASTGDVDGAPQFPAAAVYDKVNDFLYVVNSPSANNFRVMKYVLSTGAFVGWIGAVRDIPTGGAAGCTTLAIGDTTPGWCTGGAAQSKTTPSDGGFQNANLLALDVTNDYLYVSDSFKVSRYRASTGAFTGWIGKIGTTKPSGGDAGCTTADLNTTTPGWCIGGRTTVGSEDGQFNAASGMALDLTNDRLYVVDSQTTLRISKFVLSTGAFLGWIGKIATSPTGGAAGCAGAAVGTATPGWCTGGTAGGSGTGDGMFNFAAGSSQVSLDVGRDALYVADSTNHRIQKFVASTGAFVGWMGRVATSPTGGAAGCAGAAVGTATPGWCIGGTSASNQAGDKSFLNPTGVKVDPYSGQLFVLQNGRVQIMNAVTGRFVGWVGRVHTSSPTAGYTGCSATTSTFLTPGLCIGGSATTSSGTEGSDYLSPGYMSGGGTIEYDADANRLYFSDTTLNRVVRIDSL